MKHTVIAMRSLVTTMTAILVTNSNNCHITGLYRHAVKGLSADELTEVKFDKAGETFPDDRRFALLHQKNEAKFNPIEPEWLHKENFLCAFSDPDLMATFQSSYEIVVDGGDGSSSDTQRLLIINDRGTTETLLGPVNLATEAGREAVSAFFSKQSGSNVVCTSAKNSNEDHSHQFGNTSSGIKARGDTRTVHIVNAETVKCLSEKIGIPLNPTRFRPNIVLEGMEAWSEFDLVGHQIQIGDGTKLSVIKQTVRCEGINVDPLDPEHVLDIPKLLIQEFPEYGPYFGVYAVVDEPGTIQIGDYVVAV
jgi:uncharacterized protein YcbX